MEPHVFPHAKHPVGEANQKQLFILQFVPLSCIRFARSAPFHVNDPCARTRVDTRPSLPYWLHASLPHFNHFISLFNDFFSGGIENLRKAEKM